MKDRQPTPGMEGRVLITPEDTSIAPFYARLAMADNALDDGTPMIAATFLKGATAALYGLDATAVPDDVLALLKTLVDNAQTSADEKAKMQVGSYVGTGTYGSDNPNSLTFDGKPKFVFVAQKAQSTSSARGYYFTAVVNQETAMVERVATDSTSTDAHFIEISWGDKTVSWYSIANAERQLNNSGTKYVYAIFY